MKKKRNRKKRQRFNSRLYSTQTGPPLGNLRHPVVFCDEASFSLFHGVTPVGEPGTVEASLFQEASALSTKSIFIS